MGGAWLSKQYCDVRHADVRLYGSSMVIIDVLVVGRLRMYRDVEQGYNDLWWCLANYDPCCGTSRLQTSQKRRFKFDMFFSVIVLPWNNGRFLLADVQGFKLYVYIRYTYICKYVKYTYHNVDPTSQHMSDSIGWRSNSRRLEKEWFGIHWHMCCKKYMMIHTTE